MSNINNNFLDLKQSYLFSDIGKRVAKFSEQNPDKKLIRLGIGDVTLPLAPTVIDAMHTAVDEMGYAATFKGYGPDNGYPFLRQAIVDYYQTHHVTLNIEEVFVSDGAKSDVGNITDIFSKNNTVFIPDPVYPVYVDTNIMDGRKIVYINADSNNGFAPLPSVEKADLIYLCSPNNPTGSVYTREQLKVWVDFAIENEAIILFDAAYEAYISDDSLPHSIYELEGAKSCAIEFCSLSKTAGFTGTRCGYTIVPMELIGKAANGEKVEINKLWNRRQATKFNGVSYIIQKAATAVFSTEGQQQVKDMVGYYMLNAKIIAETMESKNIRYFGGQNAPYIWLECPNNMGSWEFFDYLLENIAVVGTPGVGFGKNGENYFRLTAFGNRENTTEAMRRFSELF